MYLIQGNGSEEPNIFKANIRRLFIIIYIASE